MKIKSNTDIKEKHGQFKTMTACDKIFVFMRCLVATYLGSIFILMLFLPRDTKFAASLAFIILFTILMYKPMRQSISYLPNIIKQAKNLRKVNRELLWTNRLKSIYYMITDGIFVTVLFAIHYTYLNTNITISIDIVIKLMTLILLINTILFSFIEAYLIKNRLKIKFQAVLIAALISNIILYVQLINFAFITFIFASILIMLIVIMPGVGFG